MAVELIGKAHPLRSELVRAWADDGQTLAQLLGDLPANVTAHVDGRPVPRECWGLTPLNGNRVFIAAAPEDSDFLRVAAMIAVTIASAGAGAAVSGTLGLSGFAATAVETAVAAGLTVAGSLAVNALIPPKVPSAKNTPSVDPAQSLTGLRNQAAPYAVIPKVYGEVRYHPPKAANTRTEVEGNDQYLRALLVLGYGPLRIGGAKGRVASDAHTVTHNDDLPHGAITVGGTDIGQFPEAEYEIGTYRNLSLFREDVQEVRPRAALDLQITDREDEDDPMPDNVSVTQTTATGTREIIVVLTFANGLYTMGKDGETNSSDLTYVDFKVEIAPTGSDRWTTVRERWRVRGPKKETLRVSLRHEVEEGQYDVRVTRVQSLVADKEVAIMDAVWTSLQSVRQGEPAWRGPEDAILMALRLKATDRANGVMDQVRVWALSQLRAGDRNALTVQDTRNPAWQFLDALSGAQTRKAVPDHQIDLDGVADWAAWCEANGITYDWVHDGEETLLQRVRDICAAGQASFDVVDGQYTVVQDRPDAPVGPPITPRNATNFQAHKSYKSLPHALKVKYTDAERWQQAERIVYRDGFDESTATEFEELELQGCTDPDLAWHHGMYHLRQAQLRPETFNVEMDWQSLAYVRGDVAPLAYDVILVGLVQGHIRAVEENETGEVVAVTLDEPVTMAAGTDYGVRIRLEDGSTVTERVETIEGTSHTLRLAQPVPGVDVEDLVLFGEAGRESIDVKVQKIEPGDDFGARLTLVNAAPGIRDFGEPPEFDPGITERPGLSMVPPLPPEVDSVASGPLGIVRHPGGHIEASVLIAFSMPAANRVAVDLVEAVWRVAGADNWQVRSVRVEAGAIRLPNVNAGDTLEYRLRARSGYDRVWSDYTPTATHVVTTPWDAADAGQLHVDEQVNTPPTPRGNLVTLAVTVTAPNDANWSHSLVYFRAQGQEGWTQAGAATETSPARLTVQGDGTTYEIEARTVSHAGIERSNGPRATHTVFDIATDPLPDEPALQVPNMSGLELEGQGNGTTFTGPDAVFVCRETSATDWTPIGQESRAQGAGAGAVDEYFAGYEWRVLNPDGTERRTVITQDPRFVYTISDNAEDAAALGEARPQRAFTVEGRLTSRQGGESPKAAKLWVSNPAPEIPPVQVSVGHTEATLRYTPPRDRDFAGLKVYASRTRGFEANEETLVHQGPDTSITLSSLKPGARRYYRVQPYDAFGDGPLSAEFRFTTQTLPAEAVDGLSDWALRTEPLDEAWIQAKLEGDAIPSEKIRNLTVGKLTGGVLTATLMMRSQGLITADNGTYQVVMGAHELGGTTYLWSASDGSALIAGVTEGGTFRARNADISGRITIGSGSSGIGAFADAGALARADRVDWASQVDGAGKPQDGADRTAENTARDTQRVNGTSARTIKRGAQRANRGLNGSGHVTRVIRATDLRAGSASPGLNLTGSHLGYFDGDNWRSYIRDNGSFYFGDGGTRYVTYDAEASEMRIGPDTDLLGADTYNSRSIVWKPQSFARGGQYEFAESGGTLSVEGGGLVFLPGTRHGGACTAYGAVAPSFLPYTWERKRRFKAAIMAVKNMGDDVMVSLGMGSAVAKPELEPRHHKSFVGFEIIDGELYGALSKDNRTVAERVQLFARLGNGMEVHTLEAIYDPANRVDFYVDGEHKGAITDMTHRPRGSFDGEPRNRNANIPMFIKVRNMTKRSAVSRFIVSEWAFLQEP